MLLPYGHQWINDDDINEVVKVLKSDWISQGPMVERFESSVAEYVGAKYGVAFSNGTAALHGAMFAAGLKAGDKQLTTPMTFAATSNSARYIGADVVFADISPDTYCLSPQAAEKKMTKDVKVIAPVSFAGYPVDIKAFRGIADKWGAVLIEDGCHALGAERNGFKVGQDADMTAFSFHPVKHITTGEGGMVVTNSPEYAKRLRQFRTHGITKDHADFEYAGPSDGGWYGEMQFLGFNYRLTDIQCALGFSQMKRLSSFVERRRELAKMYNKKLSGVKGIKLPPSTDGHAWHLYPFWVEPNMRLALFNHLRTSEIGVQVHYLPVHLHPYYRKLYGYGEGMFPEAEKMYAGEISLPIFPAMKDGDVDRVVDTILAFLDKNQRE